MSTAIAGRRVVVGVGGGIAAYKVAEVVSALRRLGAEVRVVMTESAARFVGPVTFRALSEHPVVTDMWSAESPWDEPHVALGEWAEACLIAPATASLLAKLACGLADDVVSATVLNVRGPVVLAPAMSDLMFEHPAVQENLERLRARGCRVVGPERGRLASGREGIGRLAEPDTIVEAVIAALSSGS